MGQESTGKLDAEVVGLEHWLSAGKRPRYIEVCVGKTHAFLVRLIELEQGDYPSPCPVGSSVSSIMASGEGDCINKAFIQAEAVSVVQAALYPRDPSPLEIAVARFAECKRGGA